MCIPAVQKQVEKLIDKKMQKRKVKDEEQQLVEREQEVQSEIVKRQKIELKQQTSVADFGQLSVRSQIRQLVGSSLQVEYHLMQLTRPRIPISRQCDQIGSRFIHPTRSEEISWIGA